MELVPLNKDKEEKCEKLVGAAISDTEEKKDRDFNSYTNNKIIAQGLLDFALLSTNVSQLKYILTVGERHPHYLLLVIVISFSFILQVLVGILLLILGNRSRERSRNSKLNQIITIIIFLITVLNVLISGFNMEVTGPSQAACKRYLHHTIHIPMNNDIDNITQTDLVIPNTN